eukprot:6177841-Pleurochrysis_carterae.AAC.2
MQGHIVSPNLGATRCYPVLPKAANCALACAADPLLHMHARTSAERNYAREPCPGMRCGLG